jgi:uncharacterized protein
MPLTAIANYIVSRRAQPKPERIAEAAHLDPAIVITGGSRGIGKALATRFAREDHVVVLVARGQEQLTQAADEIKTAHPTARIKTVACDITKDGAGERLKATVSEHGCYIDVLVNNAGLGLAGGFLKHDVAEIDELLGLNIAALTRLTHAMLPDMLDRARGGIINIGSLGGYVPGPYQAAYYASKAYVQTLTEAIAYENRGRGVRILVALPGPVGTPFHKAMGADQSLYRWLLPSLTPDGTAASIMRAYRLGVRVVVPGLVNKVLAIATGVLPHFLLLPIVSILLRPWHVK